jgi:hypothetical protein
VAGPSLPQQSPKSFKLCITALSTHSSTLQQLQSSCSADPHSNGRAYGNAYNDCSTFHHHILCSLLSSDTGWQDILRPSGASLAPGLVMIVEADSCEGTAALRHQLQQ